MPAAKNKRKMKHVDPVPTRIRNLKTEIRKIQKKMKKLLERRDDKRKMKNQLRKIRNESGEVIRTETHLRYQGIARDSKRHQRLKQYITSMKEQLKKLEGGA